MRRSVCVLGVLTNMLLAATTAWGSGIIDLTAEWRFAPDPDQAGLDKGWHLPGFDDSAWAVLDAGKRWEDQGFPNLDGYAWYRKRVVVLESMRAERVWLNLGGLNDAGIVYCNGIEAGVFGDEERVSMAGNPIAVDLTASIRWGEENVVAIRVFDWGSSGGLWRGPCTLTTDRNALAIQNLLRFVPGFDGRASVVGLQMASAGMREDVPIRFSVTVNRAPAVERDAVISADHQGQPVGVARFDLAPKPGDRILVTAEIEGETAGPALTFERTYVWPQPKRWPGRYRRLRVLNNFVTELKAVGRIQRQRQHYSFLTPRDGWVFFRVQGAVEPVAYLDGENVPMVWRIHPETGAFEAMRRLGAGDHVLRLDQARGARLDIRAVPEIAFCYWPTSAVLKPLPPRDRAFAERYVFPNTNTLLTHDDMTDEEFAAWRAEGRQWLSNASLPGLQNETAPTADFVYEKWAANPCMTRPGYSGIIVDEFLSSPAEHYAAWTEALERLYATPAFQGQTFYAWVVDTYAHEPGLKFMRRLHELGGRFAWERYLHEERTEEVALLRLYDKLGASLDEWRRRMPDVDERLTVCLGSFTTPWCSLNINPGVNYIPFMDTQFRVLATDPAFFGLLGVFQWAAHYTDDDVLRYAQRLYRHYCIEGERTPYAEYPYALNHIQNPDFADGLDHWRIEPAEPDTITAGERRGLGKIQGRWTSVGVGDACAIVRRAASGPNRISQTVRHLEAGTLYSMKFIAADLDNLGLEKEVGLWPVLDGADPAPDRSFRCVMPSSYALEFDGFNRQNRAYTTYCQVAFRPRGETVELSFSDWKDGKPSGPVGQRIGFNFVEIQPFFE